MQLDDDIDQGTGKLRVLPAFISAAPIIAAAFVWSFSERAGLPQLAAGVFSWLVVYALADLSLRKDSSLRAQLYARWGGSPCIQMLRHRDGTIDPPPKVLYLQFLSAKVGQPAPTERDEIDGPEACDIYYQRCCNWLRKNAQDERRSRSLFDSRYAWDYRRCLLGSKWLSVALDALVLAGCAIAVGTRARLGMEDSTIIIASAVAGFALFHGVCMLSMVSQESARQAAFAYARELIDSCGAFIADAKNFSG